MKLINYSLSPSIINQYMYELRERGVQRDRLRFRRNLERIGEALAFEISKTLNYQSTYTETQFGNLEVPTLTDQLVVATIFRAGLPVHNGFLNVFDAADSALIGAKREVNESGNSQTVIAYDGSANIEGKTLIIVDTMLATGVTIVDVYRRLITHGQPSRVILAGVVASRRAVEHISAELPDFELHVGAVDNDLNDELYIVPGLGDAGDLIYGTKVS